MSGILRGRCSTTLGTRRVSELSGVPLRTVQRAMRSAGAEPAMRTSELRITVEGAEERRASLAGGEWRMTPLS